MRSYISIVLLNLISISLINYYQKPTYASNQQHQYNNSLQALNIQNKRDSKPGNRGSGRRTNNNGAFLKNY